MRDPVRHRAEQEALGAGAAAVADDDEVGAALLGDVEDRVGRVAALRRRGRPRRRPRRTPRRTRASVASTASRGPQQPSRSAVRPASPRRSLGPARRRRRGARARRARAASSAAWRTASSAVSEPSVPTTIERNIARPTSQASLTIAMIMPGEHEHDDRALDPQPRRRHAAHPTPPRPCRTCVLAASRAPLASGPATSIRGVRPRAERRAPAPAAIRETTAPATTAHAAQPRAPRGASSRACSRGASTGCCWPLVVAVIIAGTVLRVDVIGTNNRISTDEAGVRLQRRPHPPRPPDRDLQVGARAPR